MNDSEFFQVFAAAAAGGLVACGWSPLVDYLRRTDWGAGATLRHETLAVGMNPAILPVYLIMWRGTALAIVIVLSTVLAMWPVGVVLGCIVYHAFPLWIRGRIRRHQQAVNNQVAGLARALGGQVRVGLPLHEAFVEVSRTAGAPLRNHLQATALALEAGVATPLALGALRNRVRVEAVTTMTVALQVAHEFGGKLSEVLDRIAYSADEVARLDRKRLADTASGRLMISLMAVFPVGFIGFLLFLHPSLIMPLFATMVGQVVLCVTALIVYASIRWATAILARVSA